MFNETTFIGSSSNFLNLPLNTDSGIEAPRMAHNQPIDVYALGNALVDILAFVDDAFVTDLGFPKGSMNLVDTSKRTEILNGLEGRQLKMKSGGSAANSMIAILQSGGSGIFAGKVAEDDKGVFYVQDMKNAGVQYDIPFGDGAVEPTGTSIILTTPDAERTMCTHLGISVHLAPEDVIESQIAGCKFCYIEGYLWTGAATKAAALKTMELARKVGTKVCFTFSDSFLVNLFADEFRSKVLNQCDIVFCNGDEAKSYSGCADVADAAKAIASEVETVFVTDGKNGAWVANKGELVHVDGFPAKAIDTVGAGDAFAGGVLYALSHGYDAATAARWGNRLASAVVEVQGPRLEHLAPEWKASILK